MSRALNSTVVVTIDASGVEMGVRRRFPRREGARRRVPLESLEVAALQAAVGSLAGALGVAAQSVEVRFGTRWAFLDVARGDFGTSGPARLQDIAEAMVDEAWLKGDAQRRVRWQLTDGGRRLFVAALERRVHDAVVEAVAGAGLRLGSLGLEFAARWNAARSASRRADGVFACIEGDHVVVARLENGELAAFDHGAGLAMSGEALDLRTDRFLARLGAAADAGSRFLACGSIHGLSPRWQMLADAGEMS